MFPYSLEHGTFGSLEKSPSLPEADHLLQGGGSHSCSVFAVVRIPQMSGVPGGNYGIGFLATILREGDERSSIGRVEILVCGDELL